MATHNLLRRRIAHHIPPCIEHAAMIEAIVQGDVLKVRGLSKEHMIDMNTSFIFPHSRIEPSLVTPLQYTTMKGRLHMMTELLASGCVPHGVTLSESRTPLHLACCYGKEEVSLLMLEELLHYGAQVNGEVKGCTALIEAVRNGHVSVIETLCAHGADVNNDTGSPYAESALICAADYHRVGIISLLCQKGADVNKSTPLLHACHDANLEAVAEFLKNGANVNLGDSSGNSPLHIACYSLGPTLLCEDVKHNRLDLLKMLLEHTECNYSNINGTRETAFDVLLDQFWLFNVRYIHQFLEAAKLMVNAGCSVADNRPQLSTFLKAMDRHAYRRETLHASDQRLVLLDKFCDCFGLFISAGFKIDQLNKLSSRYPDACAVFESRGLLGYAKKCTDVSSLSRLSRLAVRAYVHKPLANHVPKTGLPRSLQECVLLKHGDVVCHCL